MIWSKVPGTVAFMVVVVVATSCTSYKPTVPPPVASPKPGGTASNAIGVLSKPSGPMPVPTVVDLSAPSDEVVWALIDGTYLYRSTNRGTSWQQRPMAPAVAPNPEISFVDDHDGWLATGGSPATQCQGETTSIWRTIDAGSSWRLVTSVTPDVPGFRQCKQALSFVDPKRGFLGAWDPNSPPTIYRTPDGGSSWAASTLPDPPGFTTFGAGDALRAGLVHQFGSSLLLPAWGSQPGFAMEKEYIFKSADGGQSWTYIANTGYGIDNVILLSETHWLRVPPSGGWTESTDGGGTWRPFSSNYKNTTGDRSPFVFADPLIGYQIVDGVMEETVDGGHTWLTMKLPG